MRNSLVAFSVIIAAASFAGSSPVSAEEPAPWDRPHGTFVFQPHLKSRQDFKPSPRAGEPSLIIFMNRNGGTYYQAWDNDSRTNQTSIPDQNTSNVPAYPYSEESWQDVMDCMRELYAPFNILVTDVDPGNVVHVESVVGGSPYDIGINDGQVGGIAPGTCGIIDTAIVFTFPEVWGDNPRNICETAAQETAHAFGLDHENYCPDPMTYWFNCGQKAFRDYNAPCGEYENRACYCGGSTQNSYQRLIASFGARPSIPPTSAITAPQNGAIVYPQFVIDVTAEDDVQIDRVEMLVDGAIMATDSSQPYGFVALSTLAAGPHTLIARVYDDQDNVTDSAPVMVELRGACANDDECEATEVCVSGRCQTDLGETCTDGSVCASGLCAQGPDGMRCTDICDPAANNCPAGFDCLAIGGGQGACWPGAGGGGGGGDDEPGGGCGCVTARRGASAPIFLAALGLGLAALVLSRRRRQ